MKRNLLLLLCLTALVTTVKAAKVDTVETNSDVMKKKIKALVVTPDSYAAGTEFPVVYLLHGAGGSYLDWVRSAPNIKEIADAQKIMIVCADGGVTSWYWDSPVDPTYKYETYITKELIPFIDSN